MIYTVVLNSTNYYSMESAGNRSKISYAVDWSFLPQDKKFKVTTSFCSGKDVLSGSGVLSLFVYFTASQQVFNADYQIAKYSSNFLSIIRPNMLSTTDVIYSAVPSDNSPIYLCGRPSDNIFLVEIKTYGFVPYILGVDYIMTLTFEEV